MKTFPKYLIEAAIEEAGLEGSIDIDLEYSGRGMYGETCFGLISSQAGFSAFFFYLGVIIGRDDALDKYFDDAYKMLDNLRTDNMATDTILYFPGWQLT